MKSTSLILAFGLSLVAVSASAGLWDSIKKVGGEAVNTTVGIATTAADAAVGQSAEKATKASESAQAVVPSVSMPAVPSAPATAVPRPSDSPVRASAPFGASSAEVEREAYYAAEKRKRAAAQREAERRQAEFMVKRKAEYESAAKRQAAMRAERERQEAVYAERRRAEAEARRKAQEEERQAAIAARKVAQEKAEREAREARERAERERVEKAFAFHQKAHAEAAGNPDGYVYKPVAFWDGVKLSMTEAEAYAALTNANSSLSAWTTNDVRNGAGWFDGTMRTVQLSVGELNLTFAASEATGIRLLVGADASFTNVTNAVSAVDVVTRFAGLENVVSKKDRVAIDWTWKDGVNDFWHMLHDEIVQLHEASKKAKDKTVCERLARDLETIRSEFMNAVYEVTDTFTVDGVEIRVVSNEANGAVRFVTVKDVALGKSFGETTGVTTQE